MLNDIRNTFRFLRREPLLAAVVLTTLGIGIGINTAIFSVLDAVVIRPLPYPEADQLVTVWQQDRKDKSPFVASAANFLDWQKQASVFKSLAAVQQFQKREFNLALAAAPDNVKGVCVSPDLFNVLRVRPAMGRVFTADDAEANHESVVILSHDLWVGRFGSDPQIIGRDLSMNGARVTIVGVMPAGFEIPLVEAQLYLPLKLTNAERQERRIANFLVLGRLQDGVRIEAAMANLDSVAFALEQAYPESNKDVGILLTPLKDKVVGPLRSVLWATFAAAGCVLLLACLNLANVLGARGIRREREFAIRTSLGASYRRMLGQLLTEGLVISSLGGVIGLVTGMWAVRMFLSLFNNTIYFSLPRRGEISLDWRVLAFTGLACLLTAILFSLVPAWTAVRANLQSVANRRASRWGNRLRGALIMCEVTFCLALVISASLLVRSYSRLQSEDRGFSTAGVLTANITLPEARYPSARKRAEFFRHLVARAAAIPGVSSAAAVRFLPMSGVASMWSISIPGRPSTDLPAAFHHVVTPKYFEVLNIPLLEGRWFDEHDSAGRSRVAIISAAAARRYFPGNPHPVGQNIRIHDEQRADWEVVGIVGDVRNLRPDMAPRPQVYVPMEQTPMSAMTLVLRNNESSLALSRSLRNVVSAIDKEQAISEVKTLDSVVADASARWRVSASIFVMFGLAALALALIGLYGVVSYTIAQRKTEIAIRIALGSSYPGIIRMILRSVAVLGVMGTGLGLLLAVGAVQGIRTLLYTIEPLDFIALGMPAAGFLALVLIISAAAASKATRISPSLALKSE